MNAADEARFWVKVDRPEDEDECWWWLASRNRYGYGQVRVGDQVRPAHIVSWELITGRRVKPGMFLDHLCRNRWCTNPRHLEQVTPKVNTLRGEGPTATNARKTHCVAGHRFTKSNTGYDRGNRYCRACRADRIAA